MTASIKNNNKPLKWATQRVNQINPNKATYRIQKKPQKPVIIQKKKQKEEPKQEIQQLEKELEFTYDTIATITVHFESLHHAYNSSKAELERVKNPTRLCEMEKELLTAYDDLGLQVNHLERKINKLEKRLNQLKNESPKVTEEFISSPCSTTDTSSIYSDQFQPTPVFMEDMPMVFDPQQPSSLYECDQFLFNPDPQSLFNQYYFDLMTEPIMYQPL